MNTVKLRYAFLAFMPVLFGAVGCSGDATDVPLPIVQGVAITGISTSATDASTFQLDLALLDKTGNSDVDLATTTFRVYETPANGERALVYDSSSVPVAAAPARSGGDDDDDDDDDRPKAPSKDKSSKVVMAIVLDRSGSMNENEQAMMQDGALNMLARLRTGDQVEVINIGTNIYVDASFRDYNSRQVSQAIVNPTNSEGWTRIYDGIVQAAEDIRHSTDKAKRVILAITDGEDNRSENTIDQAISLARRRDAPIFTVGLADASDPSDLNAVGLDRLSSETGGRFFMTFSASFFDAILSSIARSLTTGYRLEYTSPFPDTEKTVTVEVDLDGETLTYDRAYSPTEVKDAP
jgi:VWFA-related protein